MYCVKIQKFFYFQFSSLKVICWIKRKTEIHSIILLAIRIRWNSIPFQFSSSVGLNGNRVQVSSPQPQPQSSPVQFTELCDGIRVISSESKIRFREDTDPNPITSIPLHNISLHTVDYRYKPTPRDRAKGGLITVGGPISGFFLFRLKTYKKFGKLVLWCFPYIYICVRTAIRISK